VVVEHLQLLGLEVLSNRLEGAADVLGKRWRVFVEVQPHEAAVAHLAGDLAQRHVFTLEAVLIAGLATRDDRALALCVELPRVKHAGDVFGAP
jgi:uncharacterized protein (DUF1800 family)